MSLWWADVTAAVNGSCAVRLQVSLTDQLCVAYTLSINIYSIFISCSGVQLI